MSASRLDALWVALAVLGLWAWAALLGYGYGIGTIEQDTDETVQGLCAALLRREFNRTDSLKIVDAWPACWGQFPDGEQPTYRRNS